MCFIHFESGDMQSRVQSMIESVTNVLIGYFVAVVSQIVIFPIFGIHVGIVDNLLIGLYFTAVSLIRGYFVRRLFNRVLSK